MLHSEILFYINFVMFLAKYHLKTFINRFKKVFFSLFCVIPPCAIYFYTFDTDVNVVWFDNLNHNNVTDTYIETNLTREIFRKCIILNYTCILGFSFMYLSTFLLNLTSEKLFQNHLYENNSNILKCVSEIYKWWKSCALIVFLTFPVSLMLININLYTLIYCIMGFATLNNVKITSHEWSLKIRPNCNIDYSKALAFWYFEGYLKKVLSVETEAPFVRRINEYEQRNNVQIAVPKLFLLMPTSCNVHNNLEYCDIGNKIEYAGDLIDLKHSNNRAFKMSTYCLENSNNKRVYCIAEIVTPLKSIAQTRIPKFARVRKAEIVNNMYFHLKDLLNNSNLANMCVLVPYKDMENGITVPLSRVLFDAIHKERQQIPELNIIN